MAGGGVGLCGPNTKSVVLGMCRAGTRGSFLIRRQRGHSGVWLPLVISNSANDQEGRQLELSTIRAQGRYMKVLTPRPHYYYYH